MSSCEFQLETERLILRPPHAGDFEPWASYIADEEAARYIGGAQPRAVAWRNFAVMIGSWNLQGFGYFSVIEKATGQWVGRLGPWQPEGWLGTEIGWNIARDHWGKGFAPEGASAATDWAIENLGWREVIHTIEERNANSKIVAAKLGSRLLRMGHLPVTHNSKLVEIWGQSSDEWIARRNAAKRGNCKPALARY